MKKKKKKKEAENLKQNYNILLKQSRPALSCFIIADATVVFSLNGQLLSDKFKKQ